MNPPPAPRAENSPRTIAGNAYVTDGDGVRVAGQEVRLIGLDAPEWDQYARHQEGYWFNHGKYVKSALAREIGGKHVRVAVEGTDRFGRLLGTVICEGRDIGEWLVREGHAIAAYDDRYKPLQREARRAKRGMWAHAHNTHPWVHRHRKPEESRGYRYTSTDFPGLVPNGPATMPRAPASGHSSVNEDGALGGHSDEWEDPASGREPQYRPESSGRAAGQPSSAGASGRSAHVRIRAIGINAGDFPAVESKASASPDDTPDGVDEHVPAPDPGFEPALVDGLAGEASMSSSNSRLTDWPVGAEPNRSEEGSPAAADISIDVEGALLAGLDDGPSSESALPQETPAAANGAVAMHEAEVLTGGLAAPPEVQRTRDGAESGDPAVGPVAATSRAPVEGVRMGSAEGPVGQPPVVDIGSPALERDGAPEPLGRTEDGPVAALAFAADTATERAFRSGLLDYAGPTLDAGAPQVWSGGLHAALAAFADGLSTRLVIVDIDGIDYPAGALHELAEVCEIGTVVIAVGSDDSARTGREILLAGVADYLVKPVDAAAVQEAAARATAPADDRLASGRAVGFTGTGGSGATTLAAAMAVLIAERGSHVSVLDLNRTFPAMAEMLDVDPAPGLDQLLEVAGKGKPDPQMLDGVRTERTNRISVFGYRWSPSPPPLPAVPAVDWLLGELRRRSQVVLVDGLDDPGLHHVHREQLDARALVVEPTVTGAGRTAHLLDSIGDRAPTLIVQNHTRKFGLRTGGRLLRKAGIQARPAAVIPFEPTLSEIGYRGSPKGLLPRRLRRLLARLADQLLVASFAASPAASAHAGKP